ncbi:hypothetical protein EYF80_021286 [Liparis tanakae]|uniref:Uncharacterized protein n=1 Tax=Liparis tanakae TaxID=230148 RepID=A0A4Z2HSH2_9TELE|nr:hypothetical protein EYF80_021286 [Liparis tanakae]
MESTLAGVSRPERSARMRAVVPEAGRLDVRGREESPHCSSESSPPSSMSSSLSEPSSSSQSCEFLVVSVDSSENLLTVSLQLLQLLLDDGRVQRFALLDQSVALSEHQLDLPRVQIDLLLEGLRSTNTQHRLSHRLFPSCTISLSWQDESVRFSRAKRRYCLLMSSSWVRHSCT